MSHSTDQAAPQSASGIAEVSSGSTPDTPAGAAPDVVARLRELRGINSDFELAAVLIERQQAEIERLTKLTTEASPTRKDGGTGSPIAVVSNASDGEFLRSVAATCQVAEAEVVRLRDEVERLTKERNAFQDQCIALKQERHDLRQQLMELEWKSEALEKCHKQLEEKK